MKRVVNTLKFWKDPLGTVLQLSKLGGSVFFPMGPYNLHFVHHPEYIKEILQTKYASFHKGLGVKILRPLVGNGLISSEGSEHRRQRLLMNYAFHTRHIPHYADIIIKHALEHIKDWQPGEQRMISHDMMELTLSVILTTMFGTEIPGHLQDIERAINTVFDHLLKKVQSVIRIPDWIPTAKNQEFQDSLRFLNDTMNEIIHSRRMNPDSPSLNLLSTLLAAQDEEGSFLTDEEIRDQVMTIFLAGHETTAHTLSWIWMLLAQHPEVEQQFINEIDSVLQGRIPTYEDVPHLVYINQIIHEAMRVYPVAWVISRTAIEDVEIGGKVYPKGSILVMSQYACHRNPLYFPEPDSFQPERFAGDREKTIPPFAYFPFGGGPRTCIGNHFALMEMTLILATIGQRFRMKLADDHPVQPEALVTLRAKQGIKVILNGR